MTNELLQKKVSYLERLRRAFKTLKNVDKKTRSIVPKAFKNIDPSDMHWAARPQNMLALFQKMIVFVPEPQRRLAIIDGLINLTENHKHPDIDGERAFLQDQIFRGVTGHHFTEPFYSYQTQTVSHNDLENRDFFRLIFFGIRAYEGLSPEKREKFNKAVMPNVKKQNVVVPYRLQQYVR